MVKMLDDISIKRGNLMEAVRTKQLKRRDLDEAFALGYVSEPDYEKFKSEAIEPKKRRTIYDG